MLARSWPAVTIVMCVFALDQITKYAIFGHTYSSSTILGLTNYKNFGISFSWPVPLWVVIPFTMIVLGFLIWLAMRHLYHLQKYPAYALALVFGGALGNVWDRLSFGFVRDWILLLGNGAVNIADLCITIGVLWYLWQWQQHRLLTAIKKHGTG